ncbi:hypothetical protein ACFQYP_16150 [Nonomuraea antimicrobica]
MVFQVRRLGQQRERGQPGLGEPSSRREMRAATATSGRVGRNRTGRPAMRLTSPSASSLENARRSATVVRPVCTASSGRVARGWRSRSR